MDQTLSSPPRTAGTPSRPSNTVRQKTPPGGSSMSALPSVPEDHSLDRQRTLRSSGRPMERSRSSDQGSVGQSSASSSKHSRSQSGMAPVPKAMAERWVVDMESFARGQREWERGARSGRVILILGEPSQASLDPLLRSSINKNALFILPTAASSFSSPRSSTSGSLFKRSSSVPEIRRESHSSTTFSSSSIYDSDLPEARRVYYGKEAGLRGGVKEAAELIKAWRVARHAANTNFDQIGSTGLKIKKSKLKQGGPLSGPTFDAVFHFPQADHESTLPFQEVLHRCLMTTTTIFPTLFEGEASMSQVVPTLVHVIPDKGALLPQVLGSYLSNLLAGSVDSHPVKAVVVHSRTTLNPSLVHSHTVNSMVKLGLLDAILTGSLYPLIPWTDNRTVQQTYVANWDVVELKGASPVLQSVSTFAQAELPTRAGLNVPGWRNSMSSDGSGIQTPPSEANNYDQSIVVSTDSDSLASVQTAVGSYRGGQDYVKDTQAFIAAEPAKGKTSWVKKVWGKSNVAE